MPANELTHIICRRRDHTHCGPAGCTILALSADSSRELAAQWAAAAKLRSTVLQTGGVLLTLQRL